MMATKFRCNDRAVDMTQSEASAFVWGLMSSHGYERMRACSNEEFAAYVTGYCEGRGIVIRNERIEND